MDKQRSAAEPVVRAIEAYSDMIIRIAYQNLQSREDSEDVAQEVFIKLISHPGFDDDEYLKAWLIRVTVNLCKDLLRKLKRRRTQPGFDEEWEPFSDEQQWVFDTLRSLPPKYKNVIYLYYYEGYSTPEISAIIGKSEKTVWSQLSRGRDKLKDLLIEGGYGDGEYI